MTIVNDAYNANPDSMRAALEALRAMRPRPAAAPGRSSARCSSWATSPTRRHDGSAVAGRLGVDRLVVVGGGAAAMAAAPSRGRAARPSVRVSDADAAYDLLAASCVAGDVVLLKSSRDAGYGGSRDRAGAARREVGRA